MRRIGGIGLAAAMVLGIATLAPALAQSVGDFRLQPRETSTPRAQGPVDSDAPVVRPAVRPVQSEPASPPPTPSASAAPPGPAPVAQPSPATPRIAPIGSPAPAAAAQRPITRPASPTATAAANGIAQPSASVEAGEAADPQVPIAIETFQPSPGSQRPLSFDWWWLAIPAVFALALVFWLLRKRPVEEAIEEQISAPQVQAEPIPEPSAPAALPEVPQGRAPPVAAPAQPAIPAPVPASESGWSGEKLAISLELGRMSATLVNATLGWKLMIENRSGSTLGPIMAAGDMIAAHASLPVEQQLATDGQPLELLNELAAIEPGQQTEISGEFRMPLSSINPIRAGSALLFIPLLRFRVEAQGTSTLATFAVGETPPVTKAALLPFRLDLGPRVWPQISHRQVDRQPGSA